MDKMTRELVGIVLDSLTIDLKNGHITKEQYVDYLQEVKDLQKFSAEETRELVLKLAEERGRT